MWQLVLVAIGMNGLGHLTTDKLVIAEYDYPAACAEEAQRFNNPAYTAICVQKTNGEK